MSNFDDWIADTEDKVWESFKEKYDSTIKSEFNMKFKDSFTDYESFLEEEQYYITDTLLEDEWIKFVDDEHVSHSSGEIDEAHDRYKDNLIEKSIE